MFGHLLGLDFFDSSKGLLACKQASLLVAFNGIEFILTTTITPKKKLENWAFVISIIVVRFLVEQLAISNLLKL
jgi:hypothetical protein